MAEQVEVTAEAPAPAAPAARGSSEPPGTIDVVAPLASNGWTATVSVSSPESLGAVRSLQGRFLLVGVCLAAAIGVLLLFPMRFLVRPLAELGEAARRVQRGDLSVRVHPDAEDEIGDLGRSFNLMTEAVEERTRGLETAAAELREQRDRLDAVIANLRDGLVVLGADGTPVLSNAAAAPLLEMVAARDPRLAPREDCAKAGSHESCAECLGSRRGAARTCVIDAGDRVLEVHSTPLPAGPDGRSGRVLLARDITERVSAEARQIHQERLSVLGEAAAVMAHELNNPLAAIRLYAQMAGQGAASGADVREHLDVIVRNTQSCERAIRELLDYAHGSAPEFAEVDVRAVVEDAARFVRPLAERSRVSVALLPGPEPVVSGDEIQVRQVFVNLVMNAVQAMSGSGGGRIEVAISEDAGHAVVDVCDDGPGIPEAARGRVFEPFFTTKSRGQGTGLGLPTARRIAELHGGGVELVESRPGRTVFRVRIRRNAAAPVPGAAA
ncbi:MAG: Adaptive-response sensory-kinase SasA [Planctomycetes bacterium]|nr:Adaptive-response sensory-kinase SasA [Planctomycetota bacterium]